MSENEMDYRGSKSEIFCKLKKSFLKTSFAPREHVMATGGLKEINKVSVKEQRVEGSYFGFLAFNKLALWVGLYYLIKDYLFFNFKKVRQGKVVNIRSKKPKLRYTLMGLEKGYQVKIPSKQLNFQNFTFTTLLSRPLISQVQFKNNEIKPWFLTGITDAEGCFQISVRADNKYKVK
jgi:hypothetical protein